MPHTYQICYLTYIRQFSVLSSLICNSAIDAHCACRLSRVGKRRKATTTPLLGCDNHATKTPNPLKHILKKRTLCLLSLLASSSLWDETAQRKRERWDIVSAHLDRLNPIPRPSQSLGVCAMRRTLYNGPVPRSVRPEPCRIPIKYAI